MHSPINIAIEPTNRCNIRCKMCFSQTSGRPQGDITLENFSKLVTELREIPTIEAVSLNFGGESLLHPEFEQMLELISDHKWRTGFATNGMLLTPKICQKIITTGLYRVDISLDAIGTRVEALRAGINYQVVKRNIQTLLSMKNATNSQLPIIGINCAFTNDHKLFDIMALVSEMRKMVDSIRIYPAENEDMTYQHSELFDDTGKNIEYCTSPDHYMGILWNGDTVPCCRDISAKTTLGNVLKDGILTVFNNSRYTSLREACHDNFKTSIEWSRCSKCNVWKQIVGIEMRRR